MAKSTKQKEDAAFQLSEQEAQLIVNVLGRTVPEPGAGKTTLAKAKSAIIKKFAKIGYKPETSCKDGLAGTVNIKK